MIKRIYAHNFRCLINFELTLSRLNLLIGPNGAGKSTVFDCLNLMSLLICSKEKVENVFKKKDFTVWNRAEEGMPKQRFELDLEGNGGLYEYSLEIEHRAESPRLRIGLEKLLFDKRPLYEFSASAGKARLYRDDYSSGGEYMFDLSMSGVGGLQERPGNSKLAWFRKRLENVVVVRPNPACMGAESREERRRPDMKLADFASWYRYVSQERQGQVFELNQALRGILPDFDHLRLEEAGEGKILKARFKGGREYKFDELSDGQRMLIVLYALIKCLPEDGATLCVDEPENFLALSEIQPWIDELEELCMENEHQALLISHHPRPINLLANDSGIWIDRSGDDQPSRVSPVKEDGTGVSIAHLVERGWIYDS